MAAEVARLALLQTSVEELLILRTDNLPGWQADPPLRGGGCLLLCCPTLLAGEDFNFSETTARCILRPLSALGANTMTELSLSIS